MSHFVWARPVRAVVRSKSEGDIASTLYGSIWIGIWNDLEWDKKNSLTSTMASFGQISVFPHVFYSTIDLMTAAKPTGNAAGSTRGTATATSSVVTWSLKALPHAMSGGCRVLVAAVATALVRKTDCAARWKLGVFGCAVGWNLISRSPLEM